MLKIHPVGNRVKRLHEAYIKSPLSGDISIKTMVGLLTEAALELSTDIRQIRGAMDEKFTELDKNIKEAFERLDEMTLIFAKHGVPREPQQERLENQNP